MRNALAAIFIPCALLASATALSQSDNSLTRDEVTQIKKKLVASLGALGQAPAGYAQERESFDLPTSASATGKGKFYTVGAGAQRTYGTEEKSKSESEDMSKEYQKKMMEAQAKGDYKTMSELAQEMQKKMGQKQLEATEKYKEPVEVTIRFNANPYATIDPDAVLFERPGVIALKTPDQGSGKKERVTIYIDPVALKSTKELSRVEMRQPEGGVSKKTAVLNASIELYGPAAEVESWAKRVDTKTVLAQIDAGQ